MVIIISNSFLGCLYYVSPMTQVLTHASWEELSQMMNDMLDMIESL
jgi:hypothetical protein